MIDKTVFIHISDVNKVLDLLAVISATVGSFRTMPGRIRTRRWCTCYWGCQAFWTWVSRLYIMSPYNLFSDMKWWTPLPITQSHNCYYFVILYFDIPAWILQTMQSTQQNMVFLYCQSYSTVGTQVFIVIWKFTL